MWCFHDIDGFSVCHWCDDDGGGGDEGGGDGVDERRLVNGDWSMMGDEGC